MRTAGEAIVLMALATSACTLTLDPDDGYACNGADQCDAGSRCIGGVCKKSGPTCGDYVVDPAEGCDDGPLNQGTCAYGETTCQACWPGCTLSAGVTSYCGDSAIDAANGEDCDDGNAVTEPCAYGETSCTVCAATCTTVAGTTSYCGDGDTDGANAEQCDDGNALTEVCAYGQTSCTVCSASCTLVAGATSYCGDGAPDSAHGEGCDEGLANSNAPDAACRTDCTPRRCGDEIVDAGEACDVGGSNVASCPGYVAVLPAGGFCTTACQPLSCPSVSTCGDGVVDSADGETCDAGTKNGTCSGACGNDCRAWACDREWVQWHLPGDALPDAIYDTSTAGVARDTVTDLMWQRTAASSYTPSGADTYCAALTLAGFTDWRLPTIVRLESLVDYSRQNPAINTTVFPGTADFWFWSSSLTASSKRWAIAFDDGRASPNIDQTAGCPIRCVR